MAEWEEMKQMSLIEMDGFLKGKCIPSDLKVNETNAEYLVRKFGELESKLETAFRECRSSGITIDNLEAKCEAMAAENARLKSAVTQQIELREEIKKAGRPPHADFWVQSICEAEEKVKRALEETPATDAFLAEVRAQGVEMFAQWCRGERDFTLIDEDVADAAAYEECVKRAEYFAAQLRKGGSQ
ncbi:hNH endonuclease [Escherichia coli]|nr:hNH endonuclease [Escherichia coli]MBI0983056.1 hNH endonuclease [Escherichia coli]